MIPEFRKKDKGENKSRIGRENAGGSNGVDGGKLQLCDNVVKEYTCTSKIQTRLKM